MKPGDETKRLDRATRRGESQWGERCAVETQASIETERIHEHTVCPALLSRGDWVLDVGCRDFRFSAEMAHRGCRVLALDPAPDVADPGVDGVRFERAALVHDQRPHVIFVPSEDPQAGRVVLDADGSLAANNLLDGVSCVSISGIMSKYGIGKFSVVKLDCEGSEYSILESWPGPVSVQVSVEFHDFLGMNPDVSNPEDWYDAMLFHMCQWYSVLQHSRELRTGACPNYWDSLFVLSDFLHGSLRGR